MAKKKGKGKKGKADKKGKKDETAPGGSRWDLEGIMDEPLDKLLTAVYRPRGGAARGNIGGIPGVIYYATTRGVYTQTARRQRCSTMIRRGRSAPPCALSTGRRRRTAWIPAPMGKQFSRRSAGPTDWRRPLARN